MPSRTLGATRASVDKSGKVNIPVDVSARLAWRSPTESTDAWLYVIELGRYRIVPKEDAKRSAIISKILERINDTDGPDQSEDPAEAESTPLAASNARLFPATLTFTKRAGWRLAVSKQAYPMSTMIAQRNVYLMFCQGFLEIWTPDTYHRALEGPLPETLG